MKIHQITITNYKGIRSIQIDFEDILKIKTLVGLNESGKTTILEAIHLLSKDEFTEEEINSLVPKEKIGNFSGEISIVLYLKIEDDDKKIIDNIIKSLSKDKYSLSDIDQDNYVEYSKKFKFKNGDLLLGDDKSYSFCIFPKIAILSDKGTNKGKKYFLSDSKHTIKIDDVHNIIRRELFPEFFLFKTLSSKIPEKIYLGKGNSQDIGDNIQYREVIETLLRLCEPSVPVEDILNRITNADNGANKEKIEATMNRLEYKLNKDVIGSWKDIFGEKDTFKADIRTEYGCKNTADGECIPWLSLRLKHGRSFYKFIDRSTGFNWFFTFLAFVYFKGEHANTSYSIGNDDRKYNKKESVFLLDEPASNLHSTAQEKLLAKIGDMTNSKRKHSMSRIIYTTHNPYLINTKWLYETYIVKNESIGYSGNDIIGKPTSITLEKYSSFVGSSTNKLFHFKPILDALNYKPSNIDLHKNALLVEGKNDYYSLLYVKENYRKAKKSTIDFNIVPGSSANNLDMIMQICLVWRIGFVIVLDSDSAGKKARDRYVNDFGEKIRDKIYLIDDIISGKKGMESMFSLEDKMKIINAIYTSEKRYTKNKFNKSIEILCSKDVSQNKTIKLSRETSSNFKYLFDFIENNLRNNSSSK